MGVFITLGKNVVKPNKGHTCTHSSCWTKPPTAKTAAEAKIMVERTDTRQWGGWQSTSLAHRPMQVCRKTSPGALMCYVHLIHCVLVGIHEILVAVKVARWEINQGGEWGGAGWVFLMDQLRWDTSSGAFYVDTWGHVQRRGLSVQDKCGMCRGSGATPAVWGIARSPGSVTGAWGQGRK
jgi:hypothetical protein